MRLRSSRSYSDDLRVVRTRVRVSVGGYGEGDCVCALGCHIAGVPALSGLIWPMYDMLPVWRWLAGICPSTWGVEGFVKMNANGASLSQVSGPYLNLWILAVVWWVLGYCSRRWVVRPALMKLSSR